MGFSTKVMAEMCFKRCFGQDPCKEYSDEAIGRFAKAFRDQFPLSSNITPAELSGYCLCYRGNPAKAVREFGRFLERKRNGGDGFTYDIHDDVVVTDEEQDVVRDFDPGLLEVEPEDLLVVDEEPPAESTCSVEEPSERWWSLVPSVEVADAVPWFGLAWM